VHATAGDGSSAGCVFFTESGSFHRRFARIAAGFVILPIHTLVYGFDRYHSVILR
jgi:hypothetical protein